jgi:hypothetical protein
VKGPEFNSPALKYHPPKKEDLPKKKNQCEGIYTAVFFLTIIISIL